MTLVAKGLTLKISASGPQMHLRICMIPGITSYNFPNTVHRLVIVVFRDGASEYSK